MFLMILELLIVLGALYVGSRYGSLALGAISGIGLAILVFGFHLKPGTPPTDVIYIIIAAVTCAGMLQAAGGMDWMIQIAEKMLRKHPNNITFLAPLCTFFLTVFVGTGHVVYTLMPIICDIALKKGIAAASYKRGLDLDKDPEFQARCQDPELYQYMYGNSATLLDKEITPEAKRSVYIFLLALGVIVLFSICQILDVDIRPNFETGKTLADGTAEVKPLKMNLIIQIVMIAAAACMILFAKAKPKKAVSGAVWQSGMVAVVAIYGIAWLADTYFSNYMTEMQDGLQGIVAEYPWAIAFAFFAVSVLINSQGAVVVAMLPLAYSLGIEGPVLLGLLPSVYGYFFIPNYPSDIATVNFDRSGTTVIGKYLLNHSFMMPGLISVIVSCLVGYGLITIFY